MLRAHESFTLFKRSIVCVNILLKIYTFINFNNFCSLYTQRVTTITNSLLFLSMIDHMAVCIILRNLSIQNKINQFPWLVVSINFKIYKEKFDRRGYSKGVVCSQHCIFFLNEVSAF